MENLEYQLLAEITESKDFEAIAERICTQRGIRLLHAQMGIASEGGEISDQLKKHLFYGKPLDTINLAEEIGDLFWYCALASNELGIPFTQIMETNIAKLKARYGDKFSEYAATHRDLKTERQILEQQAPDIAVATEAYVKEHYRAAKHGDDYAKVICGKCYVSAEAIPWYCEPCAEDLGKGGGLVRMTNREYLESKGISHDPEDDDDFGGK